MYENEASVCFAELGVVVAIQSTDGQKRHVHPRLAVRRSPHHPLPQQKGQQVLILLLFPGGGVAFRVGVGIITPPMTPHAKCSLVLVAGLY